MRVQAWSRTDQGNVRPNNEDNHLVDVTHGVFVVADGVGGAEFGERASELIVKTVGAHAPTLADQVSQADPVEDRVHRDGIFRLLTALVQKANADIYELSREIAKGRSMASTADVLLLGPSSAFIAHVGDSRVYLLRAGKIYRITEDHTFAEQLRREKIDDAALLQQYQNVLTRSVGGKPQVDADALFIDLQSGDRLLMCSDGLSDYLSGMEMLEFAMRRTGPGLVEALVDEAKARGGKDNITAVLIAVDDVTHDTERDPATRDTLRQVDLLGDIALFQGLDHLELLRLMRVVYDVWLDDGEVVLNAGDTDDTLYVIADGHVDLYVQGRPVASLGSGDHFGEMAFVTREPRSATARCKGEVHLLAIPAERFRELVDEDPALGNKLLWNLLQSAAGHIRRLNHEL